MAAAFGADMLSSIEFGRTRPAPSRPFVSLRRPSGVHIWEHKRGGAPNFNRQFLDGRIKMLANYQVLATGFDAPKTATIVISRPVFSPVRYMQMVGRRLRGPRNGDLAALGAVFRGGARGVGRGRYVSGRRLTARVAMQSSDGVE